VAVLSLAGQAYAQGTKPQVWTTNILAGEYPSQQAALAAVRAQGGIYVFAEKEEGVLQTESLTTFVYGAMPKGPEVGPWHKYNLQHADPDQPSEEAATQSVFSNLSATYPMCNFASITPTNEWRDWGSWYDGTTVSESRNWVVKAGSTDRCSSLWPVQGWRYRIVQCPVGLDWSSTEKACVKHDIARVSTKHQPCSSCERPSPLQHNPVNVTTGDKYQSESDFSLPWLSFSRHYHSAYSVPEGRLGPGWSHAFNIRLYLNGSSGAGLLMPSGEILPFRYIAGPYEATDGSGRKIRIVSNIYQLEEGDRTIKFDAAGKATRIDFLTGDSLTLQYDTSARLSTVTHSSGRSVTFEYDSNPYPANARLVAIKQDGIALVSYEYDSAGRLEYACYPSSTARRYHYENAAYPDHLTGITDEIDARYATYGYNADGLATSSEHAGGLYHGTFDYQPDGTTVYTDANGRIQAFSFSTDGPYRKITGAADPAGVETTTYAPTSSDFRRRPVSRLDKRGVQTTYSYADVSDPVLGSVRRTTTNEAVGTPQARTTQVWRELNTTRVLKKTEPARETIYQRNSRGQVVTQAVNEL